MTDRPGPRVADDLDALFEQMIGQQRAKLRALARSLNEKLTDDDLLSPDDFRELATDPRFTYEDGLLAGLLSAQMAVRAHLRHRS